MAGCFQLAEKEGDVLSRIDFVVSATLDDGVHEGVVRRRALAADIACIPEVHLQLSHGSILFSSYSANFFSSKCATSITQCLTEKIKAFPTLFFQNRIDLRPINIRGRYMVRVNRD